jgi:16S rRNA (adenine1518-N6/adenine1519-N6)-dimethyltransferase
LKNRQPSRSPTTREYQHQPRKRFGQNFLHDESVIQRIVAVVNPQPADHIVEIGPGRGAITRHLLQACDHFEAIELDRDLVAQLNRELLPLKPFILHQGDVLKFDFARLTDIPKSLRIVGNLPYNISTPVLFHLLTYQHLIKDMIFMLQLEVVERLAARAGDKNYGRLSLMTQYHCQVEHVFNVPSAAFTPRPKVTSAIVHLVPHEHPPVQAQDVACLQNVIRTAFTQRRKTLKNSLKTLISEEALKALGLDVTERPENLTLADYAAISDAITGA